MPLDFQTVAIAFTEGMDTRDQKKLVARGKWLQLLNQSLSEDGSLRTRDGCVALVATASGNGLATYKDELLTIAGPQLSSVSQAVPVTAYVKRGTVGNVYAEKTAEVKRPEGQQDSLDCAHGGGYTLYAWRDYTTAYVVTGINITLVDENTGTVILDNQQILTNVDAGIPRVVYADGAFFIFYQSFAVGPLVTMFCRVIDVAAPLVIGAQTTLIAASANLSQFFMDACSFSSTGSGAFDSVALAYGWLDGATSVRTFLVVRAGTTPSIVGGTVLNVFTEAQLPAATLSGLAVAAFASGDRVGVFARSTGAAAMAGAAGRVMNLTPAFTTAATQLDNSVAATAGASAICAGLDASQQLRVFYDEYSDYGTNSLNPLRSVIVSSALAIISGPGTIINSAAFGAGTSARGPQGPWIYGKPFIVNANIYLPLCVLENYQSLAATTANNNQQNSIFILDCGASGTVIAGVVVARAMYGSYAIASPPLTPGSTPLRLTPCSTPYLAGAQSVAMPATERTFLTLANGLNVAPTGVSRLTLTPNALTPPVRTQLGESTYIAGGNLATYDGSQVVEHGFPLFPEGIGLALVAGGGAMTAGVHQVVAVWEWTDNAGQRHQSAPSLPVSMTVALNDRITVTVPTLLLSQKSGVQLVVYVTAAGGLSFYRSVLNNSAFTPVSNTTAATTVAFTLASADAFIVANELLYTQPSIAGTTLPNVSPAPCTALAVAHKRLWLNKSDQPGGYAFSQKYINNVGLQFNDLLGGAVPLDAGGIVGFSALDEKVLIFCERKPFVVYGTGPNPNGTFDNYSDPQEIPSDVGCSSAQSILRLPQGVVFKSKKGWYIIDRGLQCRYIGDGVAQFDSQSVTAAVLLEDTQEARFLTTSNTLVLSYLTGQWSYTNYSNVENGYGPTDAVWWPTAASGAGRYVHISLVDGLNIDTPGVYDDQVGAKSAVGIETRARTSWIRLSELERFQRVRSLYISATSATPPASTLVVIADFDDESPLLAPGAFTLSFNLATAFPSWSVGTTIDLRAKMIRQKCKSVSFLIVENPAPGVGRLDGIQALALEIGMKRGLNKLSAIQSK